MTYPPAAAAQGGVERAGLHLAALEASRRPESPTDVNFKRTKRG